MTSQQPPELWGVELMLPKQQYLFWHVPNADLWKFSSLLGNVLLNPKQQAAKRTVKKQMSVSTHLFSLVSQTEFV